MFTLRCALENVADLYVNECQKIRLGLLKKEEGQIVFFFTLRGAYVKLRPTHSPRSMDRCDCFCFVLYFVLYFCVVYYILLLYLIVFYHLYRDVVHSFDWKSAVEHGGGF